MQSVEHLHKDLFNATPEAMSERQQRTGNGSFLLKSDTPRNLTWIGGRVNASLLPRFLRRASAHPISVVLLSQGITALTRGWRTERPPFLGRMST